MPFRMLEATSFDPFAPCETRRPGRDVGHPAGMVLLPLVPCGACRGAAGPEPQTGS